MTEVAEVTTIGEVERRVHGSGMWDGTGPVEFSDNGESWTEAWSPTPGEQFSGGIEVLAVTHPTHARVTVYRKDVRIPTTVTIRWDEQRPRENEEWAAKWDAAPTRHFGRTARMVAFRQTFRDILGDVSIEDEERTTGPAPEQDATARDWAAEIEAATDLDTLDAINKAARAVKAFTPDKAGTDLHRQWIAKRSILKMAAVDQWEPADVETAIESVAEAAEAKPRPTPQDHLPGNRASRRAKKKRGRR